jgi:peptide/nickel transport system permease protein
LRPLLARSLEVVAMMLLVACLCFAAQQALPGDAALQVAVARQGEAVSAAGIAQARRDAGFDRPVLAQFGTWLGRLARLDLGTSLVSRRPVRQELAARAGRTLLVGGLALLGGLLIALPLGGVAGLRPHGLADLVVTAGAALFTALPAFLVGLLLVALLAVRLGWLPAAGTGTGLHLVLPTLTLALGFAAPLSQVVRNAVSAAWGGFAVTFGELKGLSRWRSGLRHGLRNAAIPVTVAFGLRCAAVLEGFVVVETLFNIPGLGELLVKSLLSRDIAVIQGAALLFGLIYGVAGLAIDAACLALDPRRRMHAALR